MRVVQMVNWTELESNIEDQVWDRIYKELQFSPGNFKKKQPTFLPPKPYLIFDISHLYGSNFEELYTNLETTVSQAFINCTEEDEFIYVLDWQHTCYLFNPRLESPRDEQGEWPIPLYPNGDYYFFIKKDFSFGYIGHPWEERIYIYGPALVEEVKRQSPKLFTKLIEEQG